jgi:hypothetical protein
MLSVLSLPDSMPDEIGALVEPFASTARALLSKALELGRCVIVEPAPLVSCPYWLSFREPNESWP